MKRLWIVFIFFSIALFLTTGFDFFGSKKTTPPKNKTSEQKTSLKKTSGAPAAQIGDQAAQAPSPVLNQDTESIIEFTPEGEEKPSGPKGRKMTKEQLEKAKKLKKDAERIQKNVQMIKDAQTAMNTRAITSAVASLPKSTGAAAASSSTSVSGLPAGVSTSGGGTGPAGLPAGLQSAIETAQRVQNLQATLDKIKAEQDRIRREQQRIREEKLRLEKQITPTATTSEKKATST